MPRRRLLNLTKYNIDGDQYKELLYFCKQYEKRENEIIALRGIKSVSMDGMPRGSLNQESQTEQAAVKIIELQQKNDMIRAAAAEADKGIEEHIIKNVALGIKFEYLNAPCSRKFFYKKRRKFFEVLSKKR